MSQFNSGHSLGMLACVLLHSQSAALAMRWDFCEIYTIELGFKNGMKVAISTINYNGL